MQRALDEPRVWAFDWDGTLLDSMGRTLATYRELFHGFGIEFSEEDFRRQYSPDWRRMYERVHLPREHWEVADRRWMEIYETETAGLIPGAREAVERLRGLGHRLALVTAGHRGRVELELKVNGLAGVFDATVYGNEVPHQKPDPAPVVLTARYLHVAAGEIALVGDTVEDMTMARQAGALPIGVLTGPSTSRKLRSSGARWVARDVAAVVGVKVPRP